MMLTSRRELAAAETLFRKRAEMGENSVSVGQLINVLIFEGKLDAADSVLQIAVKKAPLAFNEFDAISTLYLRGKLDSVRHIATAMESSKLPGLAEAAIYM